MKRQIEIFLKRLNENLISACLLSAIVFTTTGLHANDASIVDAKIRASGGENMFRIDVTIKHADEGWDHYANRWDVLDENGILLGSRVLHHPHENEQPFTRSLSLTIPPSVKEITIVASDSVHGDNAETMQLAVPDR